MKTFKQMIAEVEEPKSGIAKKFKEVNTKDGEETKNDTATDAQFKGTTSKKKRIADKDKVLPESDSRKALNSFSVMLESKNKMLKETFKAGNMKLKDGSTTKVTNEEAKALNGLFDGLNDTNKKKMQERLTVSKSSFAEIVNFAKEV
ncbi:MAG: hypothetical protein COA84_13245 [Robiginitomaculum sp.]|nr:MAG: hypothetical protein COA84_13245 [Robiginitomaculum sp.]